MIPGMNGHDRAELLVARSPSLRVLFTSGCAEEVLAIDVGLVHGAAFLGGPFKPKALVTRVREFLDAAPATRSGSGGSIS